MKVTGIATSTDAEMDVSTEIGMLSGSTELSAVFSSPMSRMFAVSGS